MSNEKKSPLDFLEREDKTPMISFFDSSQDMISETEEEDEDFEDEDEDVLLIEQRSEDDEDEEPEEDNDEEEDLYEEEVDNDVNLDNPINIIAKSFVEEGILPDDIEISKDITDREFFEIYKASKEELLKNEIREELIAKEGLTPEAIQTAKQIHFGVQPESISKEQLYNSLSNFIMDEDSDSFDEDIRSFLEFYYSDINFDKNLMTRQIDRDLDSDMDDLTLVFNSAKSHFKNKAINLKGDNERIAAENEIKATLDQKEKTDNINRLLDSGEIAGFKYNKASMEKVKKALYEKTEIYKDGTGQQHRVTLYDKRRFEVANNTELSLKQMIDFILGTKTDNLKAEDTLEKAKKSVLSELNKAANSIPSVSGSSRSKDAKSISKYGEKAFSI